MQFTDVRIAIGGRRQCDKSAMGKQKDSAGGVFLAYIILLEISHTWQTKKLHRDEYRRTQ